VKPKQFVTFFTQANNYIQYNVTYFAMVPAAAARWHSGICRMQCGAAESTVGDVSQSVRHVDGIINVCAVDRTDTALCQQLALLG
jgi:hypothetical protein